MSLKSEGLRLVHVAAMGFPSDQGSQVYVRGMCRALARRGHRVSLVCYGHGQWEWDDEFELLRTPRIPGYQRLRAGPDWVKPGLDLLLAGRVARQDADVFHAHNYEAPLAAFLGRRNRPIPLFYSAHTLLEEELPSYFSGPHRKRFARVTGKLLDRSVPRLADHAIALDPSTGTRLQQLGCQSVSVSFPGIEPSELEWTQPACEDGPWVIYSGNPDAYQDLDILVKAMHYVNGAGLMLVGGSDFDGLSLGGLPKVRVVRENQFGRVRAWLQSASLAVLPRSSCPGFPIKLLNYLGMGLPTVAAEGSSRPFPGVITVPNRSPVEMAHAIQKLLNDPEGTRRLGQHARTFVLLNAWIRELKSLRHSLTFLDETARGRSHS